MNSRNPDTYRFAIAIFSLLFVSVTFGSVQPHLRLIGFLFCALTIVYLFKVSYLNDGIKFSRLLIPVLVFLAYAVILIPKSPHQVPAIENVLVGLQVYVILLFFHVTSKKEWSNPSWDKAIISMAGVLSVIEILLFGLWLIQKSHYISITFPNLLVGYRASGTLLGHPNVFSGFLNIAILLVAHRLAREPLNKKQLLWFPLILLLLIANYLTSSRSGWISLAIGLTVFVLIALSSHFRAIQKWFTAQNPSFRIIIVGTFILMILFSVVGFAWLILIQQEISTGHAPLLSSRQNLWRPAVEIFWKAPLTGNGPASYAAFFASETGSPPGFITSHAHNLLLQISAEYGLIGLFILGFGLFMYLRELHYAWMHRTPVGLPDIALLVAIFSVFALHHLSDYLLESPMYLLIMLIFLTGANSLENARNFQMKSTTFIPSLTLIGTLVIVAGWISLRGAFSYWAGLTQFRSGDLNGGAQRICKALDAAPNHPLYAAQCGLALTHAEYPMLKNTTLENAQSVFQESVRVEPSWPMHLANLSGIEWKLGNQEIAIELMERASKSAQRNDLLLLNLAWMYEKNGQIDLAIKKYQSVLSRDPFLLDTIFINSSDARKQIAQSIDPATLPTKTSRKLQLGYDALQDGDVDTAQIIFSEVISQPQPDSAPFVGLAKVYLRNHELDNALQAIDVALYINQGWPRYRMLDLKAEILHQSGMFDEANQIRIEVFEGIINSSFSGAFYSRAYYRYYIPPDKVPFLLRGYLTEGMADSLMSLADDGEYQDTKLADQIIALIEQENE